MYDKNTLTPSEQEEEPPFLTQSTEDHHQHEVDHDSLAQHPEEHSSEEIMEKTSHKCTPNLEEGRKEESVIS